MTPLRTALLCALVVTTIGCGQSVLETEQSKRSPADKSPLVPGALPAAQEKGRAVEKTDAQWREILTPLEYDVLRKKGTERAFTGEYWNTKTDGTYHCRGCGTALFRSDAKFDSGCGWPSFFEPLEGARLEEVRDTSHGMVRTEIVCKTCGGHLGHVFNDGPPPTGLRYCINSVSIKLDPTEKKQAETPPKEPGDDDRK